MINLVEVNKLIDEDIIDHYPDVNQVNQTLLNLVNSGLLNKEDKERYVFKEQVTWEVVYETLLYSDRRYLHDIIASHIEKNKANEIELYAARLVYHYQNSENNKKIIFYSALAGDYAYSLFAIDDALSFYDKALSCIMQTKNYPKNDECMLQEKKADILESIADFSEAIDLYKASLNVLNDETSSRRTLLPWKIEVKKKKPQILHKLSVAYERTMDFDNSVECLDKADDALPSRPGVLREKIEATRSVVYLRKSDFKNSEKYAKRSLKSAKRSSSSTGEAYANNILANIYTSTGQYGKAISSFENALQKYRDIKDLSGIASSCINIGVALSNIYSLEDANKYLEESLSINAKLKNKLSIMYCSLMLGGSKLTTQDYKESLEFLYKVVSIYEEGIERVDIYGVALSKIAEVYLAKNELDKSEQYLKKSISILSALKEMPDKLQQAKIIMVQLYIKQKKYADAEILCCNLLDELSGEKGNAMSLFVMRLLGSIYRDITKYEKAKEFLKNSIKLSDDMGVDYQTFCLKNVLYDVYARSGVGDEELVGKIEYILRKFEEKNDKEEIDIAKNTISLINKN